MQRSQLMMQLTNIEFEDKDASKNFPVTGGCYVNWLVLICTMLKQTGKIQDYYTDSDWRIIPW